MLSPLLLSALFFAQAPAPASEPKSIAPRDISSLLEPIRAKHDLPALVGAIVSAGALEAVGACGVRERGGATAVTIDDQFHLGSCSKAMTATLCAILIEQKKLAWDSSVSDAFGRDVPKQSPAWKAVQLQHLLSNRGGAPANLDADGLWGRLFTSTKTPREQRLELAQGVLAREPEFAPGAEYLYSNAGFSLAGAMAERAAKCDFEELMRRELFEPLGMQSAGFGPPGSGKSLDQPRAHAASGAAIPWGPGSDNPPAIAPAGRVHASICDWAKFIALHLDGENGRARQLSAESFAKLHTPAEGAGERYAMGWALAERGWAGGSALTHSGSNTMWYSVAWLAPKRDFAVLACTNQGGPAAQKACDDVAGALIQQHAKK